MLILKNEELVHYSDHILESMGLSKEHYRIDTITWNGEAYEKEGEIFKNYIGGATFLEMYDAFRLGKKIYLYNDIPNGMLFDEIEGFGPIIIKGDLNLIK